MTSLIWSKNSTEDPRSHCIKKIFTQRGFHRKSQLGILTVFCWTGYIWQLRQNHLLVFRAEQHMNSLCNSQGFQSDFLCLKRGWPRICRIKSLKSQEVCPKSAYHFSPSMISPHYHYQGMDKTRSLSPNHCSVSIPSQIYIFIQTIPHPQLSSCCLLSSSNPSYCYCGQRRTVISGGKGNLWATVAIAELTSRNSIPHDIKQTWRTKEFRSPFHKDVKDPASTKFDAHLQSQQNECPPCNHLN